MAINIEVTFVDAVTIVDAEWINLLQEHLASLATLEIDTPTATQVRILAGSDDEVAAVYIEGQQRRRDTNTAFNFTSEPSDTYDVYVTAPDGVGTFDIEVTTGTPGVSPNRKIGEVVWNGAAITSLRMLEGRNIAHDHGALDGAGLISHTDLLDMDGDPHTQLSLVDGSRAFTGNVEGITPTLDDELVTKGYVDGIATPGLPVGSIVPLGTETVPAGWFLCDGASYDTTAEATLFAITAYDFGGAGANFNVPDLRDAFPLGLAAAGTGSSMGDTGGSRDHTHTQPTHTHTGNSHTHSTSSHTHTNPTSSGPSVEHSHTQSSTGSSGSHGHTGPSHNHSATSYGVAATGKEVVGVAAGSQSTQGLYSEESTDNSSSSTSHSHGAGSYQTPGHSALVGSSSSASASHSHDPPNSYEHTHSGGSVSGTVAAANSLPISGSSHSHTNSNTATSTGGHTHSGGVSGGASPDAGSGSPGATDADGDDATGTAEVPFLVMSYIIRAS